MNVSKHLIFIIIILLYSPQFSQAANTVKDTASIHGEVIRKDKGDTCSIYYDLIIDNFTPDTVLISFWSRWLIKISPTDNNKNAFRDSINQVILYTFEDSLPYNNVLKRVSKVGKQLFLKGSFQIQKNSLKGNNLYCVIKAKYTDKQDTTKKQLLYNQQFLVSLWGGMGMELWLPSYGYFKSKYPQPFDKEGLFLGYGFSFEINGLHWRSVLSLSWSGLGKNFSFSEPLRLGFRYYTGSRINFMPQFYTGAKLSKLKLKKNDFEYKNNEWGVDFGLAFESRFERIGYHYSTPQGGYHTFELYVASESIGNAKLGTRYLFQKTDNIWMIRVSLHLEGLDIDMFDRKKDLKRYNNHNIFHKILSVAGVGIVVPIYIISIPIKALTKE